MIWSWIKVVLFVAAIAGITFGAGLLMDTGGAIRIAAAGWELNLGPLQTVVLLLVLVVAVGKRERNAVYRQADQR